jgi:hypothetical protein
LALVGALLTTACGTVNSTATPDETTTTVAGPAEVGQRRPWDGMVLPPDRADGYVVAQARHELDQLAELGAPNVALVAPVLQPDVDAVPRWSAGTSQQEEVLRDVAGLAHDAGLQVVLEVRLELPGELLPAPADHHAWFTAYRRLAVHYARLARDTDASLIVLGGRFGDLVEREDEWRAVIDAVRAHFDGRVALSVGRDDLDRVRFWDALDVIGIDTDFPEPDVPEPIAADIEKAWEPVMTELTLAAETWLRPVVLTRVGFPGVNDRGDGPPGVDEQRQLGAYEALFTVANQTPALDGVLVWRWGTDPVSGGTPDATYSPRGRPAEEVLRRAWTATLAGEQPTADAEDAAAPRPAPAVSGLRSPGRTPGA